MLLASSNNSARLKSGRAKQLRSIPLPMLTIRAMSNRLYDVVHACAGCLIGKRIQAAMLNTTVKGPVQLQLSHSSATTAAAAAAVAV